MGGYELNIPGSCLAVTFEDKVFCLFPVSAPGVVIHRNTSRSKYNFLTSKNKMLKSQWGDQQEILATSERAALPFGKRCVYMLN